MEMPVNYLSKIKSVFQTTFYCIFENTLTTLKFSTASFLKYVFSTEYVNYKYILYNSIYYTYEIIDILIDCMIWFSIFCLFILLTLI